ncbi:MAG: DsbA family protein [Candidatus Aenigmatarchaeota archaeon]
MICIVSLVVFALLGLFSARYRSLSKEAFDCVFNRIRLSPCESGLDKRVKSKIIGKVFKKNKKLAGFLSRYFEIFSWGLVLLMFISLAFGANGLYNYYQYGNCNGPRSTASCSLQTMETGLFEDISIGIQNIMFPKSVEDIDYSKNPSIGAQNPKLKILEFGCLNCPYTDKIQTQIDKILSKYGNTVRIYFMHFPLSKNDDSMELAIASVCAQKQEKFWKFKDETFTEVRSCTPQKTDIKDGIFEISKRSNLNMQKFETCFEEREGQELVNKNREDGRILGVKRTPTLFIGDVKVEGYKTYNELEKIIQKKLD